MKSLRLMLAAAIVAGTGSLTAPKMASAEEIYFIRGFMNVFSRGMDQMTNQLRARGCNVRGLSNGQWQGVARDIISRSRSGRVSYPIIIAGHSVGGQEVPRMANMLGEAGVSTALAVGVDPGFAAPQPFRKGAQRVVNYWIAGSARGNPYRSSAGFDGSINNINIRSFSNADHVQIDKDSRVQGRIVSLVAGAAGC